MDLFLFITSDFACKYNVFLGIGQQICIDIVLLNRYKKRLPIHQNRIGKRIFGGNPLFYNCHFINQMLTITQFVDDEEHVADIYRDATLEVVVEVDVTTQ